MTQERNHIDSVDRAILAALVEDGRANIRELAQKVWLSPSGVADRVKRLQRRGIVTGFAATIDPARLGRPVGRLVDVRLRNDLDESGFEQFLVGLPQVLAATRVAGEYDYHLRVVCADIAEFERFLDRLKMNTAVTEVISRAILGDVPLPMARLFLPAAADTLSVSGGS